MTCQWPTGFISSLFVLFLWPQVPTHVVWAPQNLLGYLKGMLWFWAPQPLNGIGKKKSYAFLERGLDVSVFQSGPVWDKV